MENEEEEDEVEEKGAEDHVQQDAREDQEEQAEDKDIDEEDKEVGEGKGGSEAGPSVPTSDDLRVKVCDCVCVVCYGAVCPSSRAMAMECVYWRLYTVCRPPRARAL